jgi:hypothetical protein
MTVQDALDELNAPDGVTFNYIKSSDVLEVVIECEEGDIAVYEETIDPTYDRLCKMGFGEVLRQ